ncbi:hypothetical protein NE237_021218 [Protea cynaroides]|uniref:Uncharacterized protein n=1 Tax=Protea cynaroides TaxID=273540 RepID=A0A9Q0K4N6_9MAGN|nr:hypothetical protein NE237_021218 [Protea cynaroides]
MFRALDELFAKTRVRPKVGVLLSAMIVDNNYFSGGVPSRVQALDVIDLLSNLMNELPVALATDYSVPSSALSRPGVISKFAHVSALEKVSTTSYERVRSSLYLGATERANSLIHPEAKDGSSPISPDGVWQNSIEGKFFGSYISVLSQISVGQIRFQVRFHSTPIQSRLPSGCDIINSWDRLCKTREVMKVSVSRRNGLVCYLLHAITIGVPWCGNWGFEFGAGSFALTVEAYASKSVNFFTGYFLPNLPKPRATAMVNIWAIPHDEVSWTEPNKLTPEQFKEEDVNIMKSDLRLALCRRVYPGKAMGLVTVQLWLAELLQNFKWVPSFSVDLSECIKLSLEMTNLLIYGAVLRNAPARWDKLVIILGDGNPKANFDNEIGIYTWKISPIQWSNFTAAKKWCWFAEVWRDFSR